MKSQLDKLAKTAVVLLLSGLFSFSANPVSYAFSALTAPSPVFPDTLLGNSDTQTVIITNTGLDSLTVASAAISPSGDFTIPTETDLCSGTSLEQNDTCTVGVVFTPSVTGNRTASLDITDSATETLTVPLSGVGIERIFGATPPIFSNTLLGNSDTQTVIITNTGSDSLTVESAAISVSGDFTIPTETDLCSGTSLEQNETCTVGVVFTPSETGTRTASLEVTDNSIGSPHQVLLSGVGIRPGILTSDKLDISYSDASFRNTSETSTVTITNTGSAPATLDTITVTTSAPASLSLNSAPGTCQATLVLASNDTCTVITRWNISETETTSSHALGTLRVDYNDALGRNYHDEFALVGTAYDAAISRISIFGSNAESHTVDSSTDWWDGTSWSPAYSASGQGPDPDAKHPWGLVNGTSNWINCGPRLDSPCSINKSVWFRIRFNLPPGWYSPELTFTEVADNYYTGYLNPTVDEDDGIPTEDNSTRILGSGDGTFKTYCTPNYVALGLYALPSCSTISSPVFTGENTIFMYITDVGGWAGFNYRIDLGVRSVTPLDTATAIQEPAGTAKPARAPFAISESITAEHYYATARGGDTGYLAVPRFTANPVETGTVHYSVIVQGTTVLPDPEGEPGETITVTTGGTATGCELSGDGANGNDTLTATSSGTCLITATNDGGGEFSPSVSSNVLTFTFNKATTVTNVTCPTSVVYNGAAQTPCTATLQNGDGTADTDVKSMLTYNNVHTHVDNSPVSVNYTFLENENYLGSSETGTFTITPASTTTTYTGPGLATTTTETATVTLKANISAVPGLGCVGTLNFTWKLGLAFVGSETKTVTNYIGSTNSETFTVLLGVGLWTIITTFAPTNSDCNGSSDESFVTVAGPGTAASGGGWYTLSGGKTNFGFVVKALPKTTPTVYKGQVVWRLGSKWQFKGTLTSYVKSSTGGATSGTGTLSYWNGTSWETATASAVKVTVTFEPTTTGTTKRSGVPGKVSFKFDYTPTAAQILATGGSSTSNGGLPNASTLYELKGGTIKSS